MSSASSRKKAVKKTAKKPKSKPRKTVANDETCLQMHCAKWLRDAHPGLLAFHVANEREAPVQYHVKLKRLGVMAGVADFLVFPVGARKIAIELKDDKGTQEPDQIAFEKRWVRSGGEYYLVRTLEDFQSIVNAAAIFG